MIVAAAQAESRAGEVAANVASAARLTTLAADRGARAVVLPEAFLTGTTTRSSPAYCRPSTT